MNGTLGKHFWSAKLHSQPGGFGWSWITPCKLELVLSSQRLTLGLVVLQVQPLTPPHPADPLTVCASQMVVTQSLVLAWNVQPLARVHAAARAPVLANAPRMASQISRPRHCTALLTLATEQ